MYKCKINQEFLIKMIDLKTKKRELKRFITFLEGSMKILDLIISNESTNIPENKNNIPMLYHKAKEMVNEKLTYLKEDLYVNVIKRYNFNKVHLLNHFSNIGKLKAFYKI